MRLSGARILALLGAIGVVIANAAPGGASSGDPTKPTWWSKYEIVSARGFVAGKGGSTGSVEVGRNIDVSHEPGPQSETSIAINPSNPSQIVAGSNEIDRLPMRGYFSSDGGKHWGAVDLPLPPALSNGGFDFGSDPGVAWDTIGHVYYVYIVVFFSKGGGINGTEMAVARSSDGGQTWPQVSFFSFDSGAGHFNDKPMITVDTNVGGSHTNTVYVAWDHATASTGQQPIMFSRSTDLGQHFLTPLQISTAQGPNAIGADPFVGPDGHVHVAWHDINHNLIAVATSNNGGITFGPTVTVHSTLVAFDIAIPAENVRHALIYPACDADRSAGASRGTLFCSWTDGTLARGTDIFVSKSLDDGSTWSPRVRVNDDAADASNDQFNQWLAVDPADGSVNLSWTDTRNDPTRVSTDEFFGRSVDDGQSFSPNVQVSTAPTNETCCGAQLHDQYGDYEGIAALGGSIHPVWTDRRTSVAALDEEVFTATIEAR